MPSVDVCNSCREVGGKKGGKEDREGRWKGRMKTFLIYPVLDSEITFFSRTWRRPEQLEQSGSNLNPPLKTLCDLRQVTEPF